MKIHSLFFDEDVCETVRTFVRSKVRDKAQAHKFTAQSLVEFIASTYGTSVSLSTAGRLLHRLGFRRMLRGTGMYFDGHERKDVVEYRLTFLSILLALLLYVQQYDGDETLVPVALPASGPRIELIFQDESTFYSKEPNKTVWGEEGAGVAKDKTLGPSIMLSGFISKDGMIHKVLFEAGKSRQGWWTCELLARQFVEAIAAAKQKYPDSVLVFFFDNSQNHHAKSADGLSAEMFNLNVPKTVEKALRKGWYVKEDRRVEQGLMMPEDPASPGKLRTRPIKDVLTERGFDVKGKTLKELKELLGAQPDFAEQLELLQEIAEREGVILVFLPKFHCELNPIERAWAYAKRSTRATCDFKLDTLRVKLGELFRDLPGDTCKRWFRSSFRIAQAYAGRPDISTTLLLDLARKHSSHRKVPEAVFQGLDAGTPSSSVSASSSAGVDASAPSPSPVQPDMAWLEKALTKARDAKARAAALAAAAAAAPSQPTPVAAPVPVPAQAPEDVGEAPMLAEAQAAPPGAAPPAPAAVQLSSRGRRIIPKVTADYVVF